MTSRSLHRAAVGIFQKWIPSVSHAHLPGDHVHLATPTFATHPVLIVCACQRLCLSSQSKLGPDQVDLARLGPTRLVESRAYFNQFLPIFICFFNRFRYFKIPYISLDTYWHTFLYHDVNLILFIYYLSIFLFIYSFIYCLSLLIYLFVISHACLYGS